MDATKQKRSKNDPVLHALTSKCPLCVCPDSVQHWTTQCIHPRAQTIRKDTISKLHKLVRETAQLLPAHASTIHHFGTDYLSHVTGPNIAPDVWRGLWTPNQLNTFSSSYYQFIPAPAIKLLKKLFLQLGRTLTSSCINLWIARQKTIYDLVEYMHIHPHPDYNFPTYTNNFPNSKDMPALTEDQLNTLRANATEQLPAPTTKISLHTTNRKLHTSLTTNDEQHPDTTHTNAPATTDSTPEHTLPPTHDNTTPTHNTQDTSSTQPTANSNQKPLGPHSDDGTDQRPTQRSTIAHTNSPPPTTEYTPEQIPHPTLDIATTDTTTDTTTPAQPPANINQGQLFTQQLQREASKHRPMHGGKGRVHKLRSTTSTKTITEPLTLIIPPQRHTIIPPNDSTQQRMEQQIMKMKQQHKAPPPLTQTPEIHRDTAPDAINNTVTSHTDTLQTQHSRHAEPPAPTEDTSTSTDMTNGTPDSTKERRGNFHEARRIHEPP